MLEVQYAVESDTVKLIVHVPGVIVAHLKLSFDTLIVNR